jgi:CRISPR-associated protein Cas5d
MKDWVLEVWGDYACFTRPEMKVERVSYDIITPSAARGIFEAIFWKPAISWHITKIEVLNPIKWMTIRRNEVANKAVEPSTAQMEGRSSPPEGILIENCRQQRAGLILKDVRYRLHGRFKLHIPSDNNDKGGVNDETSAKYAAMFERRASQGQCFHRPYFGCREFACHFALLNAEDRVKWIPPIDKTEDLGWMLYDLDYSNSKAILPCFFRAIIECGIVNTDENFVEVRR